MKTYLLSALAALVLGSCTKEGPAPNAVASFSVNYRVVEPNEPVAITNTSTNAVRYEWYRSDKPTQVFAGAMPTASFSTTGSYTITLTAFNSDNQSASTSTVIRVGNRYLKKIRLTKLNFLRPNGTPWDAADGPDVYFMLQETGASSSIGGVTVADVTPARLPLVWDVVINPPRIAPGSYDFAFWDENTTSPNVLMHSWTWNVSTPPTNRDAAGNSSETFITADGAWNAIIEMETR